MQFEADVAPDRPQRSIATLEDYLEAVSQRKLLVIACLLLGLLGAFAATKDRVGYYEATAKVLLNPTPAGTTEGRLADPNLERESAVIAGEEVADQAKAKLGLPTGPLSGDAITVSYAPQSDSLSVKVGSQDPVRAANLANALIDVYVADRVGAQTRFYDLNLAELDEQISELQATIDTRKRDIEFLDQQAQALRTLDYSVDRDLQIGLLVTQRNNVLQEITTDQVSVRTYQQQADALARNRDVGKVAAVRLSTATAPDTPTGIPTWAFFVAGGVAGLLLGVAVAFLRHRLDRRAQTTREVEFALGASVIGSIPKFSWRFRRGGWALLMAHDKRAASLGPTREAFRRLRSSVSFVARTTGSNVVVITSSKPLEGKSTTSANLAVTLARGGSSVALVSADLRRPSIEKLFNVAPRRGLTDFLTGRTDTVQTEILPDIPNLVLLPAGPSMDNPGELFGSERFQRLLDKLRSDFDLVIIDTPPLKVAADAVAAAEQANGVIVVVDGNRTESPELVAIRRELDRAGVPLLGAVLNRDKAQRRNPFRRSRYGYYAEKRRPNVDTGDIVDVPNDRAITLFEAADESSFAAQAEESLVPAGSAERNVSSAQTTSSVRRTGGRAVDGDDTRARPASRPWTNGGSGSRRSDRERGHN